MQDVRSTITQAMQNYGLSQYVGQAEPVITALVNRERDICGVLIEFATQQGLPRERAEQALQHAGLATPGPTMSTQSAYVPAQPQSQVTETAFTPNDAPQEEIMAALRGLQETVAGLTAFARENGYQG
jgi:hypothetical protein